MFSGKENEANSLKELQVEALFKLKIKQNDLFFFLFFDLQVRFILACFFLLGLLVSLIVLAWYLYGALISSNKATELSSINFVSPNTRKLISRIEGKREEKKEN